MNLSDERRAHTLAWIDGEELLTAPISDDARLLAVVACLICDDTGHVARSDLADAMRDPSVLQVAHVLIEEARR